MADIRDWLVSYASRGTTPRGVSDHITMAAARIEELEEALRELLDAFNPAPRVSTRLTIWGRAAMALDGTPDSETMPKGDGQ